jgi:predicted ATPase
MKIVLTGGPCSGKTTLINRFESMGLHVIPEAALEVIKQLIKRRGYDDYLVFKRQETLAFQNLILEQQLRQEAEFDTDKVTILDRGALDSLAYLYHERISPSSESIQQATQAKYDLIIVCDTLQHFDMRASTGRIETQTESKQLQSSIEQTYQRFGYDTCNLPEDSIEKRVMKIQSLISHVKKQSSNVGSPRND